MCYKILISVQTTYTLRKKRVLELLDLKHDFYIWDLSKLVQISLKKCQCFFLNKCHTTVALLSNHIVFCICVLLWTKMLTHTNKHTRLSPTYPLKRAQAHQAGRQAGREWGRAIKSSLETGRAHIRACWRASGAETEYPLSRFSVPSLLFLSNPPTWARFSPPTRWGWNPASSLQICLCVKSSPRMSCTAFCTADGETHWENNLSLIIILLTIIILNFIRAPMRSRSIPSVKPRSPPRSWRSPSPEVHQFQHLYSSRTYLCS